MNKPKSVCIAAILLSVAHLSGCASHSPLLSYSQVIGIDLRDTTLKNIATQYRQQIDSSSKAGTLIIFYPSDQAQLPVLIEGDDPESALDQWLDEALSPPSNVTNGVADDSLVAFVFRPPAPIEPRLSTLRELIMIVKQRRSQEARLSKINRSLVEVQGLANELQAAVLDSVKLGVINADAQIENAKAIDTVQRHLLDIAKTAKSSSNDVDNLTKSLEANLSIIKTQFDGIKTKLDSL